MKTFILATLILFGLLESTKQLQHNTYDIQSVRHCMNLDKVSKKCLKCFPGFELQKGTCMQCPVRYCSSCTGSACTKCYSGFYLSDKPEPEKNTKNSRKLPQGKTEKICLHCHPNCTRCSNKDTCFECKRFYYLQHGYCLNEYEEDA